MKQLWPAMSLTALFVVFAGLIFPAIIWVLAQGMFPFQANGSLIHRSDGTLVGSAIIGQGFAKPEYFHPRPSAAGNGYDATSSSGTNLGPTSDKLINGAPDDPATKDVDESFTGIVALATAYRQENGLAADAILPADAVTRSGSGLDPDISPANALLQVGRVAAARKLPEATVRQLVEALTQGRFLGIFGEPRVNVLQLNMQLDAATVKP